MGTNIYSVMCVLLNSLFVSLSLSHIPSLPFSLFLYIYINGGLRSEGIMGTLHSPMVAVLDDDVLSVGCFWGLRGGSVGIPSAPFGESFGGAWGILG